MTQPQTLDQAGIAARVPHSGSMCLLNRLVAWTPERIDCRASSHRDANNPLRLDGTLPAVTAIEYASQAMALHGTLSAAPGSEPVPGFLAAVRNVQQHVARLDDIPGELSVTASKLLGDARQAQYQFLLSDDTGRALVEGRATVVLNPPRSALGAPPQGGAPSSPA
jgi:predicted hotdog family 3-hydroxylacyl-ACP dehydratase